MVRQGEFERAAKLLGAASALDADDEPGAGESSPAIPVWMTTSTPSATHWARKRSPRPGKLAARCHSRRRCRRRSHQPLRTATAVRGNGNGHDPSGIALSGTPDAKACTTAGGARRGHGEHPRSLESAASRVREHERCRSHPTGSGMDPAGRPRQQDHAGRSTGTPR